MNTQDLLDALEKRINICATALKAAPDSPAWLGRLNGFYELKAWALEYKEDVDQDLPELAAADPVDLYQLEDAVYNLLAEFGRDGLLPCDFTTLRLIREKEGIIAISSDLQKVFKRMEENHIAVAVDEHYRRVLHGPFKRFVLAGFQAQPEPESGPETPQDGQTAQAPTTDTPEPPDAQQAQAQPATVENKHTWTTWDRADLRQAILARLTQYKEMEYSELERMLNASPQDLKPALLGMTKGRTIVQFKPCGFRLREKEKKLQKPQKPQKPPKEPKRRTGPSLENGISAVLRSNTEGGTLTQILGWLDKRFQATAKDVLPLILALERAGIIVLHKVLDSKGRDTGVVYWKHREWEPTPEAKRKTNSMNKKMDLQESIRKAVLQSLHAHPMGGELGLIFSWVLDIMYPKIGSEPPGIGTEDVHKAIMKLSKRGVAQAVEWKDGKPSKWTVRGA